MKYIVVRSYLDIFHSGLWPIRETISRAPVRTRVVGYAALKSCRFWRLEEIEWSMAVLAPEVARRWSPETICVACRTSEGEI